MTERRGREMRMYVVFCAFLMIPVFLASETSIPPQDSDRVLLKILEKTRANENLLEEIGFYQDTEERKLSKDGTVESTEARSFRTVWVEDHPYMELLSVDGRPLTKKEQEKEAKRKKEFQKRIKNPKEKDQDRFTWEELFEKFDFSPIPIEDDAAYAYAFQPKKGKLPERSRPEKILNRLSGTFSADSEFNLLKVEARLNEPVSFGLGVLARVNEFEMSFLRQPFREFWVPATFSMTFNARFALLRNERVEVQGRFYDYFLRDSPPPHQ